MNRFNDQKDFVCLGFSTEKNYKSENFRTSVQKAQERGLSTNLLNKILSESMSPNEIKNAYAHALDKSKNT